MLQIFHYSKKEGPKRKPSIVSINGGSASHRRKLDSIASGPYLGDIFIYKSTILQNPCQIHTNIHVIPVIIVFQQGGLHWFG